MMGALDDLYDNLEKKKELNMVLKSNDIRVKGRYMQKQIDKIYKYAERETNRNVDKINREINNWSKNNEMPSNPQATFI
jgi:hypothetical protein